MNIITMLVFLAFTLFLTLGCGGGKQMVKPDSLNSSSKNNNNDNFNDELIRRIVQDAIDRDRLNHDAALGFGNNPGSTPIILPPGNAVVPPPVTDPVIPPGTEDLPADPELARPEAPIPGSTSPTDAGRTPTSTTPFSSFADRPAPPASNTPSGKQGT